MANSIRVLTAGIVIAMLPASASADARKSIDRGIDFLIKDANKWREDKQCSTCHHGTLTVLALSEAKSRGYAVQPETLADMTKWTKDRLLERIDQPRDKRPGWSMVNTPALYLSLLAITVPKQDAVSANDLKKIKGHLLRHQETDGSWAWSSAPAKNRPPPFFESDEVATLLGDIAMSPHDSTEKSEVRDSRDKAAAWLAKEKPTDTTQALAYRLFREVRLAKDTKAGIDALLARQNKDGGWGQLKDAASDAYATGQAIYFLSLAGVKNDCAELRRGMAFLIDTQKEDGSWPMKCRGHPGETPGPNVVPITYFGSAWATMGLVRVASR